MLKYWLWLATRRGLGCRTALAVLRRFSTPEQAYFAEREDYEGIEALRDPAPLLDKDMKEPERILQQCYRKNIHILTFQDAAYPQRLKNIDDPPIVLYYQGTLPAIDTEPVIAMVGTRRASAYGLLQAKQLGYQLGRNGAIVVSGGASGIDTLCLTGALSAGRPVIAVLGCGVDVAYPAANRNLFEDIRHHGCLLSEYPPGTEALAFHFPVRNRILSGLSLGVVVVEAPKKSGALITADCALEQGRDVFAVPGNVGSPTCQGNIQLLKQGAIIVEDGWDVMREYVRQFPSIVQYGGRTLEMSLRRQEQQQPEEKPAKPRKKLAVVASETEKVEIEDRKDVDNSQNRAYIDVQKLLPDVTPDERVILEQLLGGSRHIDAIIDASGLPAGRILASMTLLEVKGYVTRLPGRMFCLAEKQ